MFTLKVFTVLLIANCIFAHPIFEKGCKGNCYVEGLKNFFVEFAAGKPEDGVKPMDPMVVNNINFPEESIDINSFFPELKVTGLKEVVVKSFSKAKDADVANIDLKYNLVAEGPVSLQFPKKNKDLKGTIKYEAVIDGTIAYPFSTVDGKAAAIGEPTFSCEASNAKYTIPADFIQVLENDPDASAVETAYDKLHDEHVKKVACEINKAVFTEVVENFRALVASGK